MGVVIQLPKQGKRIVDPQALKRCRAEVRCRTGCGRLGSEAHHLLRRSQGGDDLYIGNLVFLCQHCHEMITAFAPGWENIAMQIRRNMWDLEVDYLVRMKSEAWLDQYYPAKAQIRA